MKKTIFLINCFIITILLFEMVVLAANPANFSVVTAIVIAVGFLFVVNLITLGIGFASYSLLLLYMSIVSLGIYGPLGQVQPNLNGTTKYIDQYFLLMFIGLVYFFIIWLILMVVGRKGYGEFDAQNLRASQVVRENSSHGITSIFAIISLFSAFVFLPGLPGGIYRSVSTNLLLGNAWNAVSLIAYFFVLFGKPNLLRSATLILVPSWFFLHFHRVDVVGLLVLIVVISFYHSGFKKITFKALMKNWRAVALAVSGFILFFYIGYIRFAGWKWSPTLFFMSLSGMFNYLTVQDVLYSGAAAFARTDKVGTIPSLLYYTVRLLPSQIVSNQYTANFDAARIVFNFTKTNGGMLVIGEFYLNAKILGLILAPIVTYFIIFGARWIMVRLFGDMGRGISYFILIVSVTRIFWYGFIYYIKPLLVISPFLILFFYFLVYLKNRYGVMKKVDKYYQLARTINSG